jgi:hypothetical protein
MSLTEILEQARNLPPAQQQQIVEALQNNLRRQPAVSNADAETRQKRLDWLKANREAYAGNYVALDGDRLVGYAATIREAREQARANGVENPFLVRLESENTVLSAGNN